MSETIQVTVEFSVKGYSQYIKTFKAETMEEVKNKISETAVVFRSVLQDSHDKYGDFRAFCPEFANGYPSADEGEAGDELEITILTVLEEVVTTVEVEYNDDRHIDLRKRFDCD